jgi:hypothetical protein
MLVPLGVAMDWYLVPIMTEKYPTKRLLVYIQAEGKSQAVKMVLERYTKYILGSRNAIISCQESIDYMLNLENKYDMKNIRIME